MEKSLGLALNILEIIPSNGEVEIFQVPFKENSIKEYRKNYLDYSFHRDGDRIYAWAIRENPSANIGPEFTPVTITRKENTLVFNKILETGIVECFKKRRRRIYKLKYSSVWEVELRDGIRDFKGLKIIPVLNFSVHPFYSLKSNNLIAALSLHTATKYIFDADEEKFNSISFDTRNLPRNSHGALIASPATAAAFLLATGQTKEFNSYRNYLNSTEKEYDDFVSLSKNFNASIKDKIFLPSGLKITTFNFHSIPNSNFIFSSISKPRYYYYQERNGFNKTYNQFVKEFKPYSFDYFKDKKVKILVVTPDKYEGTTETFIKNLETHLKQLFHIYNLEFTTLRFPAQSGNYESAIAEHDCALYNIAIVTISELDKTISISESPYYLTKAKLLNQRVPTQEVTVEVMRRANNNDQLLYEAIALNIYSKIGGSSWTIEKVQKQKVEIVIGISSIINHEKERVIGFASIFDYNGKYLIGDCSTVSSFTNYSENLEVYLTESLQSLINSQGIEIDDPIRLIFHLTKEAARDYELKAIEKSLNKFRDYDIQFAIVHLGYNHNLRLYNNGGTISPVRGTFIQLSTYQGILHLGNGTKMPIFIRLDQRSTYKDLFDASKQVLFFCHLCYRSFRPANVPVTIKYPSLMSKLSDELCKVPRWDPNQLNKIKDKLWFI